MKKYLILLTVFLSGCSLLPSKQPAALKINTTPQATVFIDGKHMGTTPFLNEQLEAGEITLKLVPEQTENQSITWEGLIELTSGVVTVVNHEFATENNSAAGEILTLQSNNRSVASLSVVSQPDAAVVRVDGESKGFTPLVVDQINEGDHQLLVTSPGYQERTINIKAQTGYRLTVSVQLAREEVPTGNEVDKESDQASPSADTKTTATESASKATPTPKDKQTTPTPTKKATATPATLDKPYVKINETPTGWLRVRKDPKLDGEELAKVNPGDMFPLKDEQSGWYQIEYEDGKMGWIAGQYAEKYE